MYFSLSEALKEKKARRRGGSRGRFQATTLREIVPRQLWLADGGSAGSSFSDENGLERTASLRQGSLFPDSRQGLDARRLEKNIRWPKRKA